MNKIKKDIRDRRKKLFIWLSWPFLRNSQLFSTECHKGKTEYALLVACKENDLMKATTLYLSIFSNKPLEMCLLFVYCASLAYFAS